MLRHELINKEWIVSRSARSVYRAAAVLSLLLIPLLWIAIEDPRMLGPLRSMLRPLVFVGVVGMALTGLGWNIFCSALTTHIR